MMSISAEYYLEPLETTLCLYLFFIAFMSNLLSLCMLQIAYSISSFQIDLKKWLVERSNLKGYVYETVM